MSIQKIIFLNHVVTSIITNDSLNKRAIVDYCEPVSSFAGSLYSPVKVRVFQRSMKGANLSRKMKEEATVMQLLPSYKYIITEKIGFVQLLKSLYNFFKIFRKKWERLFLDTPITGIY